MGKETVEMDSKPKELAKDFEQESESLMSTEAGFLKIYEGKPSKIRQAKDVISDERTKRIIENIKKNEPELYKQLEKGNVAQQISEFELKRLGKARQLTQESLFKEKKIQEAFEFKPAALGTGEEGFLRIKADEIPEMDITKVQNKDLALWERYALNPQHNADRHPILRKPIDMLNEADLTTSHNIRQYMEKALNIFKKYEGQGIVERIIGKKLDTKFRDLDEWIEGKKPIPPNLEGFVQEVKGLYSEVKEKHIIPFYQQKILSHLTPKQLEYYNWKKVGEFGEKPQHVRQATIDVVDEVTTQIKDLQKWGIKDYFPHIWKGTYKYLNENGGIVASGQTAKQAKLNMIDYIEGNPTVKENKFYFVSDWYDLITLRKALNEELYASMAWSGTKLSKKEFFSLIGKITDKVNSELSSAGAEKIKSADIDMSGIAMLKPGEKWSAHFQKRMTELPSQEPNPLKATISYLSSVLRKVGLEDAKKKAYFYADDLPPNMPIAKDYIKDLTDNVCGRYNKIDGIIDETVGKVFGSKPYLATRLSSSLIGLEAKLKLGYAPMKAAINVGGGVFRTLLKTGFKNYAKGISWLGTKEGKTEISAISHLIGMEQASPLTTPTSFQKVQTAFWRPMGLYQAAEVKINRPQSYAAGYMQGMEKFNDPMMARKYAIDVVELTQGLYNTASMPVWVNNPAARTAYQFKQYLSNEIRFMSSLTPAQWSIYIPGIAAMAGTRGLMLTMKSIVGIGLIGYLKELWERGSQYLNTEAPYWHRGLPGISGIDVSAPSTWQIPQSTRDFIGAPFNDLYNSAKMVITGLQNNGWTSEEINDYLRSLAPCGYNIWQGIQLLQEGEIRKGEKRKSFGERWEGIVNLLGARTVPQSQSEDSKRYMIEMKKIIDGKINTLSDKILTAKNPEDAGKYLMEMIKIKQPATANELSSMIQGLRQKAMTYQLTDEMRTWLVMPKVIKREHLKSKMGK